MASGIYGKFRRITSNKAYFPEIDGIRFLAIILVLLFHSHQYFFIKQIQNRLFVSDHSIIYDWCREFLQRGDRGVSMFFVLSGFILCLPFANQYIQGAKQVSLKKYYLRRLTRLEPPYITAIVAIFLLQLASKTHSDITIDNQLLHLFATLTYTHEIIYHAPPIFTVVAWSLAIEIQFYTIAPLLFLVLKGKPLVRRTILIIAIFFFLMLQAVLKVNINFIYQYIQYFLVGILLADFHVSYLKPAFFNKRFMPLLALVLIFVIVMMPKETYPLFNMMAYFNLHRLIEMHTMLYAISYLAYPFAIAFLYFIVLKNDFVKRVFSYGWIPLIGGMCYSIYLLHYTIIATVGKVLYKIRLTDHYLPNLMFEMTLFIGLSVFISAIFYILIERPFMDQRWTEKLIQKFNKKLDSE